MGRKGTDTRLGSLDHCIQEKKVKVQKLSGILNIADESGAICIAHFNLNAFSVPLINLMSHNPT
jgi:hypothetical protein